MTRLVAKSGTQGSGEQTSQTSNRPQSEPGAHTNDRYQPSVLLTSLLNQ